MPEKKFQVPVFIDQSWKDVIFPWSRENPIPYVRVEFLKTRHIVSMHMGEYWKNVQYPSRYNMLTESGMRQVVAAAREYSRTLSACRFGATFCHILNVAPCVSGTLAERIAQIAANEWESGDLRKLKEKRFPFLNHDRVAGADKKKESKSRYRDSIWDNEEASRREKDDPANWWKK